MAPRFFDESCYYSNDILVSCMSLCNQSYNSDIRRVVDIVVCKKSVETHLSKEVLNRAIDKALANF